MDTGLSGTQKLEIFSGHMMPYLGLNDAAKDAPSLWVNFSNEAYDAQKGAEDYADHLAQMIAADGLGFDGIAIKQARSTPASLAPDAALVAAALISQTKRARIALHNLSLSQTHPHRLAEQFAMLQAMSAGRIELGVSFGEGAEFWSDTTNALVARRAFAESADLLMNALTKAGPSLYQGRHHSERYTNIWPAPGAVNGDAISLTGPLFPEMLQAAARHDWGLHADIQPLARAAAGRSALAELRTQQSKDGANELRSMDVIVHVADSEQAAIENLEPYLRSHFDIYRKVSDRFAVPPGYLTTAELHAAIANGAEEPGNDMASLLAHWPIICGTAEQVTERLKALAAKQKARRLVVHTQIGTMPHTVALSALQKFASDVLPALQLAASLDQSSAQASNQSSNQA